MISPKKYVYYEVAEFIEPYGMWKVAEFETEKEARAYCTKHLPADYQWRKVEIDPNN